MTNLLLTLLKTRPLVGSWRFIEFHSTSTLGVAPQGRLPSALPRYDRVATTVELSVAASNGLKACHQEKVAATGRRYILRLVAKGAGFHMSRRKQFQGICDGILGSFVSRYNDFNGYWALGQYVSVLNNLGERQLQLKLTHATETPDHPAFALSEEYYGGAVLRMMEANAMPPTWLADATIRVSIVAPAKVMCEIEIVSDLGKTYRSERTITVRPHDPAVELRRGDSFGPY
ncbi:hypothetical protein [Rhizobium sp. RM]|uniref:hypothetical protein n=1 Tax=Rhizobium sp. RM TaxID=2748079 RepID=UPI00110D7672|nr:hypothetical protein [Rhizobium sp. RM]NWJ25955.1 hypothetical protein [Rhizobium sp. RM]TMV15767.1 hypothetical protein BJG94_21785 [Rhizobium sp. Td3]